MKNIKIKDKNVDLTSLEKEKLITFFGIDTFESRDPFDVLKMFHRIKQVRLKSNIKPSFSPKYINAHLSCFLTDLDFGPVDRILRFLRKKQAKKYLPKSKNLVLLDVGCGRQANLGWHIRDRVFKYIGLDRDIPEVKIRNLEFIRSTAEGMTNILQHKSVDVITALAVIEHIDSPDEFISNCRKLLKPNGTIILTTPAPYADPILKFVSRLGIINNDEIEEHKTYFTPSKLKKLLISKKFQVTVARTFLLGFNGVVVAKKLD